MEMREMDLMNNISCDILTDEEGEGEGEGEEKEVSSCISDVHKLKGEGGDNGEGKGEHICIFFVAIDGEWDYFISYDLFKAVEVPLR